jgi:RHS repeat-associated protein
MQTVPGNRVIAVKHFDIPVDFPFDVSDNPFEIRYNNDMNSDIPVQEPVDIYPGFGGHGTSENYSYSVPAVTSANMKTTPSRIQSTTLVDTYYIYSYDGKLLAEYDHNGNCVKDYIYAGNRLIAEYYPPPIDKYYYYMSDQVNSIRIVTDNNGDVVYSAAYGPYGEVEKVWNNTYEPKLKFSGKERDEYTDLDYFGGRYYDHKHYRFNSVDPIINKEVALMNPQLWNLYAYCRNNPLTFFDPDGNRDIFIFLGAQANPAGPNFNDLGYRARRKGDTFRVFDFGTFTMKDFRNSLKTEDAITFFIGHSSGGKTLLINEKKYQGTKNLANDIIGIFTCSSGKFAFTKFKTATNTVIALDSGPDSFTSDLGASWAAYYTLLSLITGNTPASAIMFGNKGFVKPNAGGMLWSSTDIRDKIVFK